MSFKEDSAHRFQFFIRKNTVFIPVFFKGRTFRHGHLQYIATMEATVCKMSFFFFLRHISCVVLGPSLLQTAKSS